MEVTASNTLDFNTKMGYYYGIDVDAIFNHPIVTYEKYRVKADPYVNVRESPSASSRDIGDKLYLEVIKVDYTENGWAKLFGEPGWVSLAWLEKI